MKGNTVTSF